MLFNSAQSENKMLVSIKACIECLPNDKVSVLGEVDIVFGTEQPTKRKIEIPSIEIGMVEQIFASVIEDAAEASPAAKKFGA